MFLLRFDLRIPPFVEGLTPAAQYGEMLEMVRWADGEGFAGVVLSEHHGTEDGFMNAPSLVRSWVPPKTSSARSQRSSCHCMIPSG